MRNWEGYTVYDQGYIKGETGRSLRSITFRIQTAITVSQDYCTDII